MHIAFDIQAVRLHDVCRRRLRHGFLCRYASCLRIRILRTCDGYSGKASLRHTEFRAVKVDRCTADVHFHISICMGFCRRMKRYIISLCRRGWHGSIRLFHDIRYCYNIQTRFIGTRCKLEVHILSYIHLAAEHMDLIADNFRILERQSVRRRG